jgi:hypothetical protein
MTAVRNEFKASDARRSGAAVNRIRHQWPPLMYHGTRQAVRRVKNQPIIEATAPLIY